MIAKALLLAGGMIFAAAGAAQPVSSDPAKPKTEAPARPEKVVEGDTPDRVAQIERCQGHKFETSVEIDAVKRRSTRIKLCANPGSTDADWVKTLESAVVQIEQRAMPPEAKDKLIAELRGEIAKFAAVTKPVAVAPAAPVLLGGDSFARQLSEPPERYQTSVLPPLPAPRGAATATRATAASAAPPQRPMRISVKCLEQRQLGAVSTCNYFLDGDTILVISAVEGLEDGGIMRFVRRGDPRGEVALAPLAPGKSVRVRLPGELCRGVSSSKVEIELLPRKPGSVVAARLGPYGLRC